MPIQITTQPAILTWDTQNAQVNQSGNGAQTLDIQTKKPILEITSSKPQISIDQTQSFADAGRKNLKAFMDDAVNYGLQIVQQGTARIVDQGNSFIQIHTGVDPIPDQALYNAYEMFEKEFNYGAIPQSRPTITLNRGQVNYNFRPGSVNNQTTERKVEMNYTPWQVNYYMKQYNSINFRYEPSQFKFTV